MKKKILSLLLAIVMVCSLLPTAVFAEGETSVKLGNATYTVANAGELIVTEDTIQTTADTTVTTDEGLSFVIAGGIPETQINGMLTIPSGTVITIPWNAGTKTIKFTGDTTTPVKGVAFLNTASVTGLTFDGADEPYDPVDYIELVNARYVGSAEQLQEMYSYKIIGNYCYEIAMTPGCKSLIKLSDDFELGSFSWAGKILDLNGHTLTHDYGVPDGCIFQIQDSSESGTGTLIGTISLSRGPSRDDDGKVKIESGTFSDNIAREGIIIPEDKHIEPITVGNETMYKVSPMPTDYVYGNSQGVANDEIAFTKAGGKVTLTVALPAGVYADGASGQFGFDFNYLADGVEWGRINCEAQPVEGMGRDTELSYQTQSLHYNLNNEEDNDTARAKNRPLRVMTYTEEDGSFNVAEPAVFLSVEITVPAGLEKDAEYKIYMTPKRTLYWQKEACVFTYQNEAITAPTWVITINDASEVNANDIVIETGKQPVYTEILTKGNVTGKDENGDAKVFTTADFDTAQWSAIKAAAEAGKVGDYELTISSDSAQKEITVTLADHVAWQDKDNYLYANDFVADCSADGVTFADVVAASDATFVKAGNKTNLILDNFNSTELAAIDAASKANTKGNYPVTITTSEPELSVTPVGTLFDHAKKAGEDPVITLAGNDFEVLGKSIEETEITEAWFLEQAGVIALEDGAPVTPTVDADTFAALKEAIVNDVNEDTVKTVKVSYGEEAGKQEIEIDVTVKPGDKSEISATSQVIFTIYKDNPKNAAEFAVAVDAEGKDYNGNEITTWTDANFEGLYDVIHAERADTYEVVVKPTTGSARTTVQVILRTVDDGKDDPTTGRVWANDVTLETGDTTYDNAKLIADTKAGGFKPNSEEAATLVVTDTDKVIDAMKAGETGEYSVTFKIQEDDSVSATVTVTLVDHMTKTTDYILTANDFSIGTGANTTYPTGNLDVYTVLLLSDAELNKNNGNYVYLDPYNGSVTIEGLTELNEAKNRGEYGDSFDLTITYTDEDGKSISTTIKVTLDSVRYLYDWENNKIIDSNDVSIMMSIIAGVKTSSNTTEKSAWLCVFNGNKDKDSVIDSNDVSGAVSTIAGVTDEVYIQVPYEYLNFLGGNK